MQWPGKTGKKDLDSLTSGVGREQLWVRGVEQVLGNPFYSDIGEKCFQEVGVVSNLGEIT